MMQLNASIRYSLFFGRLVLEVVSVYKTTLPQPFRLYGAGAVDAGT